MIYINVEQLGAPGARPALLGVLATGGDPPVRFTSYVLDPRLAGAAVASRACRVADLATALAETLANDGPVVAWSAHDLRVIRNAGLPARLVKAVESRWLDARKEVTRWKNRVHRDRDLPALDQADDHALRLYMKAIGADVSRALAPDRADAWLRHVLERLEATGGNYRALSARAKRHWHALLDDHRYHCAGLRAVYERASRELALEAAYRQTTYRVEIAAASYPIRIGRRHRVLDTALRGVRATQWAVITAHNPQSVQLSARENERRDAALKRKLRARGIRWYPTEATGDNGDWPAERGVLALGVTRGRAGRMGRDFDQAAIVWGRVGGRAELVWCNRLLKVTRRSP
jgi:hypothetical protein